MIDTGGFEPVAKGDGILEMARQTAGADEADIVIFWLMVVLALRHRILANR